MSSDFDLIGCDTTHAGTQIESTGKEGVTAATFLDGNSQFWGIDLHPLTETWLCVRNAEEEIKLLKREAHNLNSNIEVEIKRLTEALALNGAELERANDAEEKRFLEGVKTFLVRQLDQSNNWKTHSKRHLVLLRVAIPTITDSGLQSDTARLLDPTADADEDEESLDIAAEGNEDEEEEDDEEEDDEEEEEEKEEETAAVDNEEQ
ncbi:uncharacterized protein EV154DRAFT_561563 [Mucor mucedo]|uniref:uncharacterized protein n=1 Tax=Mucor mucedo TaxID=29922 RepID=UPI0022210CB5|nr:uncharacterized protein EV154DRAFT_561563 [Mucor mucedo]KAI7893320.1 hypothetical protein EV154DRAFT_561563 [Mucor mucedo]